MRSTSTAVRSFHNQFVRRKEHPPGITLILDEAREIAEATYNAALGVLTTGEKSKAFFMGSAGGKNHWFFRAYLAGLEGKGDIEKSGMGSHVSVSSRTFRTLR